MIVTAFYKYVKIEDVENLRHEILDYCNNNSIKGRILVGSEGINGSCSGENKAIFAFQEFMNSLDIFEDMSFKDNYHSTHPFKKMVVKIRSNILNIGMNVDPKNTADHIEPEELKELFESGEDFIILDNRNDYETKIGTFKNAIPAGTKNFREFSSVPEKLKDFKDKKVVMVCTGGIRCEKASAVMKQAGFKDVVQLKDGILNYIEKYPDGEFEGRCFVFDQRLSIPSGKKNDVNVCDICAAPANDVRNCKSFECDKLFLGCFDCFKRLDGACSKTCQHNVSISKSVTV